MGWMDLKSKGLTNMPGIPEASYTEIFGTVNRLRGRKGETEPAIEGLSHRYTIAGQTGSGKDFLFGGAPYAERSIEDPKQFAMGWTTHQGVYADGAKHLDAYAKTLTSADDATASFWPMIAEHETAYNLLVLRKVTEAKFKEVYYPLLHPSFLEEQFGPMLEQGRLYEIDMSLFESLGAWHYHGKPPRFNPATLMLLEKHPTKPGVFEPKWIRVWTKGHDGKLYEEFYSPYFTYHTPGGWLYALQAVKSAVTMWGIWLGHVYHWHMVSAAMIQTMLESLPGDHTIRQLLAPQSDYLIGFNYVLLDGATFPLNEFINFQAIAPPSRIADVDSFLKLTDQFAAGRRYFDDDPTTELERSGLNVADFTHSKPWDLYPVAKNAMEVWGICEAFVRDVVNATYHNDAAVKADTHLHAWLSRAAHPNQGNIHGLPGLVDRGQLTRMLTSLVYRLTAHGRSRLLHTANPALTFVANFPPCLQSETIPSKSKDLKTKELLAYLPNTTTMGDMLNFYFAFVFSKPYVPLLPSQAAKPTVISPFDRSATPGFEYYFPGDINNPCNAALVRYRLKMEGVMGLGNIEQWPRNIET